jgi:hypothetical protein
MSELKIVPLYESNYRDPVATLREIADEIEAGKYGDVREVAVVVYGDTLEAFGAGAEHDGATIALLFQAAAHRMIREVANHGR